MNLELESISYLKYAIELVKARVELQDNFAAVGIASLLDVSKLPVDIFTEILEQDYIFKKNYPTQPAVLFDELKRKTGVNTIDVLMFLQKAWREA
jgi:hypothetical protein